VLPELLTLWRAEPVPPSLLESSLARFVSISGAERIPMDLRNGFVLGDWTVLPLESRLVRDGESRRVRPKSMDVLLCLACASGDVVERDELLREVWGERAMSDEPLTRCIGELRRAFDDARSEPDHILTIPKRGYRLLKTPGPLPARDAVSGDAKSEPDSVLRKILNTIRKPAVAIGLIVLAVLLGVGIEKVFDRDNDQDEIVAPTAADIEHSIAVLPFVDMSEHKDQEYMGDGVAEELLNLLTKIPELRVISRSSTFSLKGSAINIQEVAEQFNVAYVLEGSVRKSGDSIRITAQLIDGDTDTHVWSEVYERELHDVFQIQDEIAQAVVSKLQLTILGQLPTSRPTDPEAYSLFLQGRYLHEQPEGDSMLRALDYYKAALEIDPDYVPAWVWLAALYDDTVNSIGLPREEVGRLAREAIRRALVIDPNDPLALGMSAVLTSAWDNDLAGAAEQMQIAINADPGNPILLRWSAIVLTGLGQHEEAVRVNEFLFERDPVGNIAKINLAATYLNAGRYDDAIRVCRIEVAVTDESSPCGSRLILAYMHAGQPESALVQLERTSSSRVYTRLAPMVMFGLGRQSDYERAMDNLVDAYEGGDVGLAYWIAYAFGYVGDADATFEWLERARDQDALTMAPNKHSFAPYRDDPRWTELMATLGTLPAELQAISFSVPPLN